MVTAVDSVTVQGTCYPTELNEGICYKWQQAVILWKGPQPWSCNEQQIKKNFLKPLHDEGILKHCSCLTKGYTSCLTKVGVETSPNNHGWLRLVEKE